MPGKLKRNDVLNIIKRSKLNVHPSKSEGLPRVIVESFACGVPVVVLKNVIPAGFEHEKQGLMVPEEELNSSVCELLNNNEKLKKMGLEAYKYAKSHFTQEAVAKTISKMYNEILFSKESKYKAYIKHIIAKFYLFMNYTFVTALNKIKRRLLYNLSIVINYFKN